ncbi:hypothetical protein [Pseudoalteromonas sp. Ld20]
MKHYSAQSKESALQKMMPPNKQPVRVNIKEPEIASQFRART